MADIVAEAPAQSLESLRAEYDAAVPASAPPPTLEQLLAEFERGTGSDESARVAGDMIRARDTPAPDPAAEPPANPEAPTDTPASVEAESPQPDIYRPAYDPPWLREQLQAQSERELDAAVSSAIEHLKTAGASDEMARDKLNAILTTDAGFQAFERRDFAPKQWNALLEKGRAAIEATLDAAAARRVTNLGNDIQAARAAVNNSGMTPMPEETFDPVAASRMSDSEWRTYIENKYPNVRRR